MSPWLIFISTGIFRIFIVVTLCFCVVGLIALAAWAGDFLYREIVGEPRTH